MVDCPHCKSSDTRPWNNPLFLASSFIVVVSKVCNKCHFYWEEHYKVDKTLSYICDNQGALIKVS